MSQKTHQQILDQIVALNGQHRRESDALRLKYQEKRRPVQEACGKIGHVWEYPVHRVSRTCVVCQLHETD